MKKIRLNYLLVVLTLIIFSCETEKEQQLKLADVVDYAQLGTNHNLALDRFFHEFKVTDKEKLTVKGAIEIMEISAYNFIIENHPNVYNSYIEPTMAEMNKLVTNYTSPMTRTENEDLHTYIINETEDYLSDKELVYVNQIIGTLTTGESNLTSIQASLQEIENNILSDELDEDELHTLLSSISVAKSSAQYWHDNFDLWVEELGTANGKLEQIDWGKAGAADVAAAVSVGTVTSEALVVPFIGWGAWLAITGGATAIVSGVSILLD